MKKIIFVLIAITIVAPLLGENIVEAKEGYTTTNVNVRTKPSTKSKKVGVIEFNKKIDYIHVTKKWVKIKYNDKYRYVCKQYISNKKQKFKTIIIPNSSGFKSYMPYAAITLKGSKEYKLQREYAYTGKYGIRQIKGRYCVALGTAFNTKVGTYVDLQLKNGAIIPCIVADTKANKDTEKNNITTSHNGCVSEFIVNTNKLKKTAKLMGDISYCNKKWNSPVAKVKIYKKNVFS